MSIALPTTGLGRLLRLRGGEKDRIGGDLARECAAVHRYREQLDRLHDLAQTVSPISAGAPALASNNAAYRQTLTSVLEQHEQRLLVQEARVESIGARYREATLGVERLTQVHERQLHRGRVAATAREQKRMDQMAVQAWQATRVRSESH